MSEIGYAVSNGQFLLPTSHVLPPLFHCSGWLESKLLVQRLGAGIIFPPKMELRDLMLGQNGQRSSDHVGANALILVAVINLNVVDTKFLFAIFTTSHQANADNLTAFRVANERGALEGKKIVPISSVVVE